MDKTKLLQKLSEELSANSVFADFQRRVEALQTDNLRLGIMGQPNTAKTTLVNCIVGTSLPVSTLPSQINYVVSYGMKTETIPINGEAKESSIVKIDSKWLKDHKLTVLEINNDIVPDETSSIDLCTLISQFDACVYLLNAQSALNRTDLFILNNLNSINMPVLLVLSRMDVLSADDQKEVQEYVKGNISEYQNITLLNIETSIKDGSKIIKEAIENLLKTVDLKTIRSNFENFFMTVAVGQLYEICQKHIDECTEKKSSIDKLAVDKLTKLEEKTTDWLKVETALRQKISFISEKLRSFLTDRKEDMIRRLSHDVDVCGDIKLFWEKDFPFRLEELVRGEMSSATQLVNQELIKVMQWLQDELLKQFRCKISLTTGIVGDRSSGIVQNPDEVSIADTQKLKIVTRIGTAATVIAAGALFATSGIGGIIMAVSMISGIGAEFFMKKQTNDSKEQIKKLIPDIIERTNLQLVTDFESKVQEVTANIIEHVQTLKTDWFETSKKTIEQEKAIANFNLGSNKWDSIMARINQLSELIIN